MPSAGELCHLSALTPKAPAVVLHTAAVAVVCWYRLYHVSDLYVLNELCTIGK